MKRSDMVKKLQKVVNIVQGPQEQNSRLVSQIIKEAEFLGMLPPNISIDPYDMYCKWEDEND